MIVYEISRLPLQYFANATGLTHQAPTTIHPLYLLTNISNTFPNIHIFYFIINLFNTACFICPFINYLIRLLFGNVVYQKPSKKIAQNLPYHTNQLFKNAPFLFSIRSRPLNTFFYI